MPYDVAGNYTTELYSHVPRYELCPWVVLVHPEQKVVAAFETREEAHEHAISRCLRETKEKFRERAQQHFFEKVS